MNNQFAQNFHSKIWICPEEYNLCNHNKSQFCYLIDEAKQEDGSTSRQQAVGLLFIHEDGVDMFLQ
jgi:hypothetical protein